MKFVIKFAFEIKDTMKKVKPIMKIIQDTSAFMCVTLVSYPQTGGVIHVISFAFSINGFAIIGNINCTVFINDTSITD